MYEAHTHRSTANRLSYYKRISAGPERKCLSALSLVYFDRLPEPLRTLYPDTPDTWTERPVTENWLLGRYGCDVPTTIFRRLSYQLPCIVHCIPTRSVDVLLVVGGPIFQPELE